MGVEWSGVLVVTGEDGVDAGSGNGGEENSAPQQARQVLRTADAELRVWGMLWNEW